MMKLENVDKYYNINTSSEVHALKNINLSIEKGETLAWYTGCIADVGEDGC